MTSTRAFSATVTAFATSVALAATGIVVAPTAGAQPLPAPSGVDVASHQHPGGSEIDWKSVKSDGQSFAFVKASEGSDFVNPHFRTDVTAAAAQGLKVGAYHYALPSDDPKTQAAHFAAQLEQVGNNELPPVLDIEVSEGKSPKQLQNWVRDFTAELKRLTGRTPMIYTYQYFWMHEMGNTTEFADMPLWLAAYQSRAPKPVGGWKTIAFWQRSGNGRVTGIDTPVDMNLFNGNGGQLNAFAGGDYSNVGGVLENLEVGGMPDLGKDSTVLIGAVLALAAGVIASPQLADAAEAAGLSPEGAKNFADTVAQLHRDGQLPISELEDMARGEVSVGDLALLLENVEHASR